MCPQLSLFPPEPAPLPSDGPLTVDELRDLSLRGWELVTIAPDGRVTMRDMTSEGWSYTETRGPGGWRVLLS